jgi:hydroxymethylbilane synthase
LAIECRADDPATQEAVAFLNHADTRLAVTAERAALRALGGGCQAPIGIHCRREGASFRIDGVVASSEGGDLVRASTTGTEARVLGESVARLLLKNGAEALLFAAKPKHD